MNLNNNFIKYFGFSVFFLFIMIILIVPNKDPKLVYNSYQHLYPSPIVRIKYQVQWQKDFYFNRIKYFEKNPIGNNKIVFLGNSITEGGGDWSQRFNTTNIVNRGISGDITNGILSRLDEIIFFKPLAIFLLIGVNDFFNNSNNPEINPTYVGKNILEIASKIKIGSPNTIIYIQTILPINNQQYMKVKKVDYNFLRGDFNPSINFQIRQVNSILRENNIFPVINLYEYFVNNAGVMDTNYSTDGVHLNQKGYQLWVNNIAHIIKELKQDK